MLEVQTRNTNTSTNSSVNAGRIDITKSILLGKARRQAHMRCGFTKLNGYHLGLHLRELLCLEVPTIAVAPTLQNGADGMALSTRNWKR